MIEEACRPITYFSIFDIHRSNLCLVIESCCTDSCNPEIILLVLSNFSLRISVSAFSNVSSLGYPALDPVAGTIAPAPAPTTNLIDLIFRC
jgi:hypothetical protein